MLFPQPFPTEENPYLTRVNWDFGIFIQSFAFRKITVVLFFQGNHFDQYEEGHLEIEQASLDKPIESVRSVLNLGS